MSHKDTRYSHDHGHHYHLDHGHHHHHLDPFHHQQHLDHGHHYHHLDHGHHIHHLDHGHHHHGHSHGHHGHDFVASNKQYCDNNVDKDDKPHWVKASKVQALAIRAAFNFEKEKTTVLDFACGAGTLSRELFPYAKSITGVEVSQGTIDAFNAKAAEARHGPDVLRGIFSKLKGEDGELEGVKFDLVTCRAAYHRFSDYNKVTNTLAKFLKPGGMLCVLDRLATHSEEGRGEKVNLDKVIPHKHGLVSSDLIAGFQEAGLKDYSFEVSFDAEWENTTFKIFLAKGVKPGE